MLEQETSESDTEAAQVELLPDLFLGLPMTQWPTVRKERTGNNGDPPQHREPKPTRDNPPPVVLPLTPPGPSGLKKSKETNPKRNGHETQGKHRNHRQPNPQIQGNTTTSGGSNRHKQQNQQQQGVWDTPVPNRKKPQPCIGLFPIARPQHTNATDKTIPNNSRTPPTDRSVYLKDP